MRTLRFRWWVLGAWLCGVWGLSGAGAATPDDVARAAAEGLPGLLAQIPDGMWSEYGFANGREVAEAKPGRPMPVQTITPAALNAWKPGDPIGGLLSATSLWYVPVRAGGQVRAVLVVDWVEGGWQAVSLGYVPLAGPLGTLLEQWPESGGYHPQLVMVVQAQQYLFTVPELGGDNLTPLSGLSMGSRVKEGRSGVGRLDETVAVLKPVVDAHLAGR